MLSEYDIQKFANSIASKYRDDVQKEIESDPRYFTSFADGTRDYTPLGKARLNNALNVSIGQYDLIVELLKEHPDYYNLTPEQILSEATNPTGRSVQQIRDDAAEKQRKADFGTLLQPGEDGRPVWYSMDNDALKKKAKGLGFNWDIPEDRSAFMDYLRGDSEDWERANTVKEFDNSIDGKFAQIVSPTATDEARKQALTGNYDDNKMYNAAALDFGVNSLEAGLGGFALGKAGGLLRPITEIFSQAALQGAAETARQGAQAGLGLGDEEFNFGDVALTAGAGATTPSLKGIFQSTGKVGKYGKQFAEGVESTTKGTPLDLEQEAVKEAYKRGEDIANGADFQAVSDWKTKALWDRDKDANDIFILFKRDVGVDPETFFKDPNKFTKQEVLTKPGIAGYTNPKIAKFLPKENKPIIGDVVTGELNKQNEALRTLLPETYRNAVGEGSPAAKKFGVGAGKFAEYAGGRVEPTFKIGSDHTTPIEEQEWFKALPKKKQKLIKDSYNQKLILDEE